MSCLRIGAAIFAAVGLWLALVWDKASTPSATLSELATISLGDQTHYATIRSQIDRDRLDGAPVLLILHGGPGASDIPFIGKTDQLLEKHFIVVHYDQRSSGKSCRFFDSSTSVNLTVRQHMNDAVEMLHYLRKRFDQEKIYLLGGSWGSVLALLLARDVPHLFHHVAVRGLVVDVEASELLSNQFILSKFPEFDGKVAPPPYDDRFKDMEAQRAWLYRAGGMNSRCLEQKCSNLDLSISFAKSIFQSPEMSWADVVRFKSCFMNTIQKMWPEVQQFKAADEVTTLTVPLLVLQGRHDHCTDSDLVLPYLEKLQAPSKRLVWFEKSAHSPQMEEPLKFQHTLIEEFLGTDA